MYLLTLSEVRHPVFLFQVLINLFIFRYMKVHVGDITCGRGLARFSVSVSKNIAVICVLCSSV